MKLRLLPCLFTLSFACADPEETFPDATVADAGTIDRGVRLDATELDAEPVDLGTPDSGFDAGTVDTGPPQSIIFLHTNDEHSQHLGIGPNLDDFPAPDTRAAMRGGLYRRAKVLENLRNEARAIPGRPGVVTVSAGDIMMGSLFHIGNAAFGIDYVFQELLGYDVLTLGNHEFDFGSGALAGMLSSGHLTLAQEFETLTLPLVISNIRFSMSDPGDDALAALYGGTEGRPMRRTHIQQFGNVRVGFVGVVGLDAALVAPFKSPVTFSLAVDNARACTSNADCAGSICVPPAADPLSMSGHCALDPSGADPAVNFPALVADIASAVAELRAQNVDLVVAISHSGVDEREINTLQMTGMGLEEARRSEEILLAVGVDQALAAANVDGIDLIIGGHSHSTLDRPLQIPNLRSGINTYLVQAGSYGRWVGKLRLSRPTPQDTWQLDEDYSRLVPVDGTVGTNAQVQPILENVLNGLMDFLESDPIASPNDGLIFPGEQCDTGGPGGLVLPNGGNCAGLIPGATGGRLGCGANQQLDLSACVLAAAATCGNGAVDAGEMCDGALVPPCATFGYPGGTSSCHANCTVSFAQCTVDPFSLLEVVVNFQREGPPVRFDGNRGSLFFYEFGFASFDVGETAPFNESNLANLVADANRWASNEFLPRNQTDPVRMTIVANGVIRDGLYEGQTGVLSLADLFRVVPLGVSPIENTPGFSLTDFYLSPAEVKLALEVGLSQGLLSDSFWLGVSGAQVTYDLSRPALDRVTRIDLLNVDPKSTPSPWDDVEASYDAFYNLDDGGFVVPANSVVHVGANLYVTLYATAFGICPRTAAGQPYPHCAPCTQNAECTVPGATCDTAAGQCSGGPPVAFSTRTLVPLGNGLSQELKEFLALSSFIRHATESNKELPSNYNDAVPRRMCCEGTACPADASRTCMTPR